MRYLIGGFLLFLSYMAFIGWTRVYGTYGPGPAIISAVASVLLAALALREAQRK